MMTYSFFGGYNTQEVFERRNENKCSQIGMHSEISDMTSEWLGEMFEGDSADMCAGKFPLVSMGG